MNKPDKPAPDVEATRKRLSRFDLRHRGKITDNAILFDCGEVRRLLTHIDTLTAERDLFKSMLKARCVDVSDEAVAEALQGKSHD